ncbi:MAG TPA: chromosome segregation protein SMC [Acidimicrobiales bacterium]|nr:chromosome segregation protein SMC [Acidimicrobiales bacterium]
MFLKSLTLKGFKSFADTTTLEFEPGLTVVVGPNGSGKSNVVDAVAWVLGAQGPRALRSGKMEDVIFAGTAKRPALGRAEVSLTIDNSSGMLPVEFAEVTITRILFRSGDSEYSINGVPCRLLDVQELLSDSGVGRQQHVIVSQGNLDAILNSRPEDRRLVIEEAAGVLKFRRRRERAQRRLDSTEGNLTRLSDLLREVRRQLRPLERQAAAARRSAELAGELGTLRLHVAGRQLTDAEARLRAAGDALRNAEEQEGSLRAGLASLSMSVAQAEADVSAAAAGDGLADLLGRMEGLRQRTRGVANVLGERRRSVQADLSASRDEGVVASLESDAADLVAQLREVDEAAGGLVAEAERVESAERAVAAERRAVAARWGERDASVDTSAAEVRARLAGLRRALERDSAEASRLRQRCQGLEERAVGLGDDERRLTAELDGVRAELPGLQAEAAATENARREAESAAEEAEVAAAGAHRELHSWQARADALALALDEAAARAGAERLAGVSGVVGTLLELVEVDEGWQAAFEAAAGEALAAVVVADPDAAGAALAHLRGQGASGAVLPLAGTGTPAVAAAAGGRAVRGHVRSSDPRVDGLLDRLLGAAVAADDWREAMQLAGSRPDLVVVSPDGDRFSNVGWRTGAAGAGATGAALEEARSRAESAASSAAAAAEGLRQARAGLVQARDAEAVAVRAASEAAQAERRLTEALLRAQTAATETAAEAATAASQLEEVEARLEAGEREASELDEALAPLEERERAQTEDAEAMRAARRRVDEMAAAASALRADLEVHAAGLEERRALLTSRLADVESRLAHHVAAREQAAARRSALEAALTAIERLSSVVAGRLGVLEERVAALAEQRRAEEARYRAAVGRLENLRAQRAEVEGRLDAVREAAQAAAVAEAEGRMRLEAVSEMIRNELQSDADQARSVPCPELPTGVSPEARLRDVEAEMRSLGPVNPLALEEFAALEERHAFLQGQLDDVKEGRRDLAKVIRAIDSEIVEVFAAAYADVASNFADLFASLFPGGVGQLRLTDPDNLLETGVEIEGRPSGKNVKRLSLLSGGERSLTALAFLFAVFRSRPSPFYLMDEVEAALDDVNLHRFVELIEEFRGEAQLVVVSHQRRTMEAADCLYGVSMQPGGSSKVVSEKVKEPA